ncbi:MAG: DHH family phosphoesterase [Bacilli bacterium]|jgi:single-stranded-DNA-specific exonuclease
MNTFLNKLLNYYALSKDDFAYLTRPLSLNDVRFDQKLLNIDKIKKRIFKAIENKEKIIVYGDYDCDGIMSLAIITKTLEKLNSKISYYAPSRYLDGYGLTTNRVEDIIKGGYSLIILVDNGISAFDAIKLAKEHNIDTIVVDHHEVQDTLPDAYAILHPSLSKLGDIAASAGLMSFILSCALLDEVDPYLLSLAGISTISDMMPLVSYNRDVVRLTIKYLNENTYPQITALVGHKEIDEKVIAMEIAPRINAIGRVDETTKINRLVKYFVSEDIRLIHQYARYIDEINESRKKMTKEIVDNLVVEEDVSGIVLNLDIKEGLIGLIANRLVNEYQVPTIVFTSNDLDKDVLKGSIRSKEGFNVIKAFGSLEKYLLTYGGHIFAGGVSIKKSDFENFKKDFIHLAKTYQFIESDEKILTIQKEDINFVNYEAIRKFAPFGEGFKAPLFVLENVNTSNLTYISNDKHLSVLLDNSAKILGFYLPKKELSKYEFINLYGHIIMNEYRGKYTVEFRVLNYKNN